MITLTLLHPVDSTPLQSWTFADESVIGIGRAMDNKVVLHSSVVSRHHVELRQSNKSWELVNLGANGTYLDGELISQVPVVDGLIIRLASSGPQLQIRIGAASLNQSVKCDLKQWEMCDITQASSSRAD